MKGLVIELMLIAIGAVAGAFLSFLTTMSSFALETARFIDERFFGRTAISLVLNVGFSIGAIIAGRQLVNALIILRGGSSLL